MERMDEATEKRIFRAMEELGFETFILIGSWRDPEKKGEWYETCCRSIPGQQELDALGDCIRATVVSNSAFIPFFQGILDRAARELAKPTGDHPT
jgi:hypothetical protein